MRGLPRRLLDERQKRTYQGNVVGTLRVPDPHTECAVYFFLPLALSLALATSLLALPGCAEHKREKVDSKTADRKTSAVAVAEEALVLETDQIDLLPGAEKQIKISSGKAALAEAPQDVGLTASVDGNALSVVAAKDAKEGVHEICVRGRKGKPAVLKVHLKADAETANSDAGTVTAAQVEAIAEEAFIYSFPMLMNYKTMFFDAILRKPPTFKAPLNEIWSGPKTSTPGAKPGPAPGSDVSYSVLWIDLRAEPLVLSVPEVEKDRDYSIQLTDLYGYGFASIGSRTTGNAAGLYLVAGPGWKGEVPDRITKELHAETGFGLAVYRTQQIGPGDVEGVKKVQAGYVAQPLSEFLKQRPARRPASPPFPIWEEKLGFGPRFVDYVNFVLRFCPPAPQEVALREKFAKIGIVPGAAFEFAKLPPEHRIALDLGVKSAMVKIKQKAETLGKDGGRAGVPPGGRDSYRGDWLLRASAASAGVYP